MGEFRFVDDAYAADHGNDGGVHQIEELRLFDIGDAKYIALPLPKFPLVHTSADGVFAVTIIACAPDQRPSHEWVKQQVDQWLKTDDVFRLEFLKAIIFIGSGASNINLPLITDSMKAAWGTSWCASLSTEALAPETSSGPYVSWNGRMCKAYRLYDDVNDAFMVATKPQIKPGPFENLRISGDFYQSLSVAVPSRIPPVIAVQGPLHGVRFAVKDVFEIEGLRVTAGNRAFYSLSQPSPSTAPSIQRLLDAGAHFLGTLKLGSLIAREEPTESVDYHAPFNSRADGYQSAWSSSGGSGAAIAAYDWIDFTLGTDTTGSSRRPAMANGCFQLRLSHDALSLERVVPSFPIFDAPAMFCRDIMHLEKWVGAWLCSQQETYDDLPVSLVYLRDFLPIDNKDQMQLMDSFITDIESTYGIKTEKVSIAEKWAATVPAEAHESSVKEYLKDVGVNSFCYGAYHCLDQFRTDYREKFGKEPYVNPVTRWRWDVAQTVSSVQYNDALHRMAVYKKWILQEILQVGKRNTMLVLPITTQQVDYREDPPGPPTAPQAFDAIWLAPVLGAPEISIPVGEIKYHSRISQREEHLPVVVSLLGKPGSDMALINAAQRVLKKSGRSTSVVTGSRMFK